MLSLLPSLLNLLGFSPCSTLYDGDMIHRLTFLAGVPALCLLYVTCVLVSVHVRLLLRVHAALGRPAWTCVPGDSCVCVCTRTRCMPARVRMLFFIAFIHAYGVK